MNKIFVVLFVALAVAGLTASVEIERRPRHTIDFNHFWTFAEIEDYLEDLAVDFPDMVFLENLGTTSENRQIRALRLSYPSNLSNKPIIIIESGIRAREWIAPMANLYLIHELVEHSYDFVDLLSRVDLIFLPIANPDGYIFSHTSSRNWNKNRRSVGSGCFGVDLGRNFGFEFASSSDPCNENFSGTSSFSEAETTGIRDLITRFQLRVQMYLSIQAFGQFIMTPYNHVPAGGFNFFELQNLGRRVSSAIQSVNSRVYQVGTGGGLAGTEPGTPSDFSFSRGINLSFTWRLPRGGTTGFDVPEREISGIVAETFVGFLEFANHVAGI